MVFIADHDLPISKYYPFFSNVVDEKVALACVYLCKLAFGHASICS